MGLGAVAMETGRVSLNNAYPRDIRASPRGMWTVLSQRFGLLARGPLQILTDFV